MCNSAQTSKICVLVKYVTVSVCSKICVTVSVQTSKICVTVSVQTSKKISQHKL